MALTGHRRPAPAVPPPDHEAKMTDPKPSLDDKASRVAMVGIIAGMALTAAGMFAREPILGALGLGILFAAVVLRRPIARLLPPR